VPAHIDPVTGCVSLDSKQAEVLLSGGGIEALECTDSLLRSFMHEFTHHASLIGDVGCAASALCLGTADTSMTFGVHPPSDKPLKLDLRTRDWVLHRLFKDFHGPVLEGLALFSEYDLYSCPLDVESSPLLHAKALYLFKPFLAACREAAKEVGKAGLTANPQALLEHIAEVREKHFNAHLRAQRLTPDAVWMKTALLSQPLLAPPEGERPYLLGYLAMKGCYLQCGRFSPLRLSTLFHVTLQHVFFRDTYIAEALVSIDDLDAVAVQLTLKKIVDRIEDRLEYLLTKPKALLAELEFDGALRELDPHLQVLCGLRTVQSELPLGGPAFMGHRHLLRHAYTPVVLEHGLGTTTVRSRAGVLLGECPRVKNANFDTDGSIELIQTPDIAHQCLVVLTTDGLVAARCLRSGEWNRPEQVEMFDLLPSATMAYRLLRLRRTGELPYAQYESGIAETLEKIAKQIDAFRDHVLLKLAFPLSRDDRKRASDALAGAGFASLFPDEIEELARYSLVFGGEGLSIAEGAAILTRTEAGCRKRVDQFNAKSVSALGVKLFNVSSESVVMSAI
jgi:hypothetical protein